MIHTLQNINIPKEATFPYSFQIHNDVTIILFGTSPMIFHSTHKACEQMISIIAKKQFQCTFSATNDWNLKLTKLKLKTY